MITTAQRINDVIRVTPVQVAGIVYLSTDCADFDAWNALPVAVDYEGTRYVKTGWNSDTGIACYKPNAGNLADLRTFKK